MQVLCPSCETEYEIPELQRPRKLRCARCASEWRVVPETETALAAPEPDPVVPAADEDMAPAAPADEIVPALAPPLPEQRLGAGSAVAALPGGARRDDLVIGLLWLASLALIAAGLWALWHWRGPIAHHWPASLRIYRLLPGGLSSAGPGRRAA